MLAQMPFCVLYVETFSTARGRAKREFTFLQYMIALGDLLSLMQHSEVFK